MHLSQHSLVSGFVLVGSVLAIGCSSNGDTNGTSGSLGGGTGIASTTAAAGGMSAQTGVVTTTGGTSFGASVGGSTSTATGGTATGGTATGGTATGTTSTITSITVEETDAGFCGALGVVATDHSGYTGAGYLDSENLKGVSISWVVTTTSVGTFDLVFRFANGGNGARSARLRIGHADFKVVDFASDGNWDSWQTLTTQVTLESGDNHISLVSENTDGLANIDSLTVTGSGVTSQSCRAYAPGASVAFESPTFTNVSVHDPSVIKTGSTYYVFGSHLAAAKTTDFMQWTMVADQGVVATNPLFDDVTTELADAFAWSTVVGLWAPDVVQLKSTGKYLMYYNSCQGSSPRSALGIAAASGIEGAYADQGIILYSGMWGETSPDGTVYDATVHPNAIDPNTFYDKDGILRMVYGSYSGGIFIMQMDSATGAPVAGQGYGTHLWGGNHAPIEGPYLQYSPDTGYYYLFTSYGGLDAAGGYNLRVARATSPNGPYYDALGTDMAQVKADPTVPLFDTVTIAPSGVKIAGNHVWANTSGTHGYVSSGHNSSYYDATTGHYFLIFHTRFPLRGEEHEVRVHQMFMNIDGWPVVAPLRYAPRTNSSGLSDTRIEYVGLGEVQGTYQFINHEKDISSTIKESVTATVSADGSVTGSKSGTWVFGGNNVVVFNVDGTAFRGVVSRQWNEYVGAFEVTFTGVDANGVTLWGIRTGN